MRQLAARNDLVQSGEIEIGFQSYRYGSLFLSQLRLSPKQFLQHFDEGCDPGVELAFVCG